MLDIICSMVAEIKSAKILNLIRMAEVAAQASPDADTKVGSILVSKKTGSIVSTGFNGFARGVDDSAIPKTRPEKYQYVIHAESNLICNAARNGVTTDDCFVVQTHSPCVHCARLLHQCGIKTVYYKDLYRGTAEVKRLGDLQLKYTAFDEYTKIEIEPTRITEGE
jgi:dCMP deaminase